MKMSLKLVLNARESAAVIGLPAMCSITWKRKIVRKPALLGFQEKFYFVLFTKIVLKLFQVLSFQKLSNILN
jgi:hypothetical protein